VQEAVKNPALFAKANGGRPAIAATPKPAAFNAPGVVGAHGAAPLASRAAGGAPPNAATHMQPSGQPPAAHPQVAGGARPPAPPAGKAPPPKPQQKPQQRPKPENKHEEGK
jgi:hypothetical protein